MPMRKMTPGASPRGARQRGQVIVLFALALLVIMGMVSIAIDGGFGLVQARRAQNGADFASVAGARMVSSMCNGGVAPSNQQVTQEIQDIIDLNAPDVGTNWTGFYLDSNSVKIPNGAGGFYTTADAGSPPGPPGPYTACGVTVTLNPNWKPYFAQVIGQGTQKTQANATAVNKVTHGVGAGIVALDEVSPHQVLGGGKGSFNVYGTIFANSTVPYDPWGQDHNGKHYVDVVDAKGDSNLILNGDMQTVGNNWPLDWCFGVDSGGSDTGNLYNKAVPPNSPNKPVCNANGTATSPLQYNNILTGYPVLSDPLGSAGGGSGLPDPFDKTSPTPGFTQGLCSGQLTPTTFNSVPAPVGGVTTLQPGDYTVPVVLTGNVDLADCSGAYDSNRNTITVYPGVFRFEKGVSFRPVSGATVRGNNVMVATGSPVPVAGNVPGSVSGGVFTASGTAGNGAPCFPHSPIVQSSVNAPETDGTHPCAGTSSMPGGPYDGVITKSQTWPFPQDNNNYGTGTNFSLILGGAGTITISAPNTGPFKDITLFQNRNVPGNFGLDAVPGDSATVTITSFNNSAVVYNVSLPCKGYPMVSGSCTNNSTKPSANPFDFWDEGTTFHSGGTLQAGAGTGNHPYLTTGSVTIVGPCVVEDFNTDGNTVIKIDGSLNSYALPGVLSSGNPPISG